MTRLDAVARLKGFEDRFRALGVTSLFLFGSTARGEATSMSDVDLFVDVDPAAHFSIFELVRAKHMVEDDLRLPVDLGTRDGLRPAARRQIECEAIRIF